MVVRGREVRALRDYQEDQGDQEGPCHQEDPGVRQGQEDPWDHLVQLHQQGHQGDQQDQGDHQDQGDREVL